MARPTRIVLDTIINGPAQPKEEPVSSPPAIQPPPLLPKEDMSREVNEAFAVITKALKAGHKFTFEQMNTGVELSIVVMPESDGEWIREIAHNNGVPLWQAIMAQYRRNHENGMANNLLLDPGWQSGEIVPLQEAVCIWCNESFLPKAWGQKFCSNAHGAEAERKALGLPPKEELPASPPVASKEDSVTEDFDAGMVS